MGKDLTPEDKQADHQRRLDALPMDTVVLYSDGSKLESQFCGSGWAVYCQGKEHSTGKCNIGRKAEVFDAELHAIHEGLMTVQKLGWQPRTLLICADNQSALQTLTTGNPLNMEFARNTLIVASQLIADGWSLSGLWTPALCGILGNERVDALAKAGAEAVAETCTCSRTTRTWMMAQAKVQQLADWNRRHPPRPEFPITPSTTFPADLRKYSPMSVRGLFMLLTATTPSDPHPSNPPERCLCGGECSSLHILLYCPRFMDARMDLIPSLKSMESAFDTDNTPHLVRFLRRTGLGFSLQLRDGIEEDSSEADDLDVGPLVALGMDLDI